MTKIGIVGYGIVGKAVDYGFRETHPRGKEFNSVIIYDKFKPDISKSLEDVVKGSEFIFVCLPTPMTADYTSIDLKIMDGGVQEIAKHAKGSDSVVVLKSTIVPGTTRKYASLYSDVKFAFNPEFLTEANYLQDFINPDRIIIGADNDKVRLRVIDLYRDRFQKEKILQTDTTTAEMVKYAANCYLATKVTFANQMFGLCEKLGIKWEEVKHMFAGKDGDVRIYDSHLDITSERGFGGKCFPKDIVALIGLGKELGVDLSLLENAWDSNLKIRKHRDWEDIPFATSSEPPQ